MSIPKVSPPPRHSATLSGAAATANMKAVYVLVKGQKALAQALALKGG